MLTSCVNYQSITVGPVTREYDVNDQKRSELYIKDNTWMTEAFTDAKSVIQFNYKEDGIIVGKYLMFSNLKSNYSGYSQITVGKEIFAMIKINVKDNAARLIIEPIGQWQYDSSGMTIFSYSKEKTLADIEHLISSSKKTGII